LKDAIRCGRKKARQTEDHATYVQWVESIYIFLRRNGLDDALVIYVVR
jgi:hypothetical protein